MQVGSTFAPSSFIVLHSCNTTIDPSKSSVQIKYTGIFFAKHRCSEQAEIPSSLDEACFLPVILLYTLVYFYCWVPWSLFSHLLPTELYADKAE